MLLISAVSNYPMNTNYAYGPHPRIDFVIKVINRSSYDIALPLSERTKCQNSMFRLSYVGCGNDTLFVNLCNMTSSDYVIIPKHQSASFALFVDYNGLIFLNQTCDSTYMGFFLKKVVAKADVIFEGSGDSISIFGKKYKVPNRLVAKRSKGFVYDAPDEPSSD